MASVNKNDLAQQIADQTDLSTGQAKVAVEKVLELVTARLAAGDEISLAGFGKFTAVPRAAREGKNPSTGETIQIAATTVPKFSAASALKAAVKG